MHDFNIHEIMPMVYVCVCRGSIFIILLLLLLLLQCLLSSHMCIIVHIPDSALEKLRLTVYI